MKMMEMKVELSRKKILDGNEDCFVVPIEYQVAIQPAKKIDRAGLFKGLVQQRVGKLGDHPSEKVAGFQFPVEGGAAIGLKRAQSLHRKIAVAEGADHDLGSHIS